VDQNKKVEMRPVEDCDLTSQLRMILPVTQSASNNTMLIIIGYCSGDC
jgi:hypothetical protein